MNPISTQGLQDLLSKDNTHIIDCRPIEAYNGWKLMNEKRGGHIKGARCLPVKWTKYIDWIEIVRSKGILTEDQIVVYAYYDSDAILVGNRFIEAGFHNISIYNGFVEEWSKNISLPMDRLERFEHLVSAEWVKEHQHDENTIVLHAHYRNRDAYLSSHIPGAVDIDTLALEAPDTWNRRDPEELQRALKEHGIHRDSQVILYGKHMFPNNDDPFPGSAAGHIGAIRCAFILLYAGLENVRVLNGGFQSWKDAGFEISTADESKRPVGQTNLKIPLKPELAVDVEQAKKMLSSKDAELVCVRSWPEYIGEVSGYNYIEKTGRIPGAIFGNCGSDAYHMENYRNLDHTSREFNEIKAIWEDAGITPDKHNAFYCGTGWRGSEAFFNAWLMGWPRVSVFDGGWFEWSNDSENPYETGLPHE